MKTTNPTEEKEKEQTAGPEKKEKAEREGNPKVNPKKGWGGGVNNQIMTGTRGRSPSPILTTGVEGMKGKHKDGGNTARTTVGKENKERNITGGIPINNLSIPPGHAPRHERKGTNSKAPAPGTKWAK